MERQAKEMNAKFTEGKIMHHVIVMTATSSIGLVAIFFVDFLNLFYIAMLGQQELAAAIGYSGTILFMHTSVGIGASIAGTALVARALGAGDRESARRLAMSSLVYMTILATLMIALTLPFSHKLLTMLGATGRTLEIADRFLWIVVPSNIFLGLGMMYSSILRAVGDGPRAMWVTLAGGLITAGADPLLIFGFKLGIDGAAYASIIARLTMTIVGFYGVVKIHDLASRVDIRKAFGDFREINVIAIPAVITNLATPVGNGFVTTMIARYGDGAVAGWAIVGRILPMAFVSMFSLSGAVGPIMSQNLGARLFDRVQRTLTDSLIFIAFYGIAVWIVLIILATPFVRLFDATGTAADLIVFFCQFVSLAWALIGAQFTANAAFNNLGFPTYSTFFNWGRATLGTIPFAWLGEWLAGPNHGAEGILAGSAIGGAIFGLAAVVICYRVVDRLRIRGESQNEEFAKAGR